MEQLGGKGQDFSVYPGTETSVVDSFLVSD